MKYNFIVLISILISVVACKKKISENQESDSGNRLSAARVFQVEYSSPSQKIKIDSFKIWYTEIKETYDNPVSAVPSKRIESTRVADVSITQIDSLISTIQSNGFLNLNPSYGAPDIERFYPYYLKVKLDEIGIS